MNDSNLFRYGGGAAILLAVLFPIYWLYVLTIGVSGEAGIWGDFQTLNGWDALFVLIGALEIFVYLVLRKYLSHHLNAGLLSALLWVMIGLVAIFHGFVVVDIALATGLFNAYEDALIASAMAGSLTVLFLFALVSLIFAIALLTQFSSLPTLIKVFSIGLIVVALMQLTVILGVVNIVLFPILMLLLAIQFLRGEQSVEVV